MTFEIVITKKAQATFNAIRSQIFNKWGEKGVMKFEQRTVKVFEVISQYPLLYQEIEYDKSIRKAHIHKNCSLFYHIRDEKIVVAFFWDNRQDPILL